MKPLKDKTGQILDIIKTRQMSENGRVYVYFDVDEKTAGYYDGSGNLIYTRRMTPDEYQTSIRMMAVPMSPASNGE